MYSNNRLMKRIVPVLIAISLLQSLSGCATDPVIQTRIEIQKIPESLTVACPIPAMDGGTYQAAIEFALALRLALGECNARMEDIRRWGR